MTDTYQYGVRLSGLHRGSTMEKKFRSIRKKMFGQYIHRSIEISARYKIPMGIRDRNFRAVRRSSFAYQESFLAFVKTKEIR